MRRNNRILQKFYDAVYIDARDSTEKKGKELTNGRISRNHKKDHENLHPYRKRKVSKGHVSIRRGRSPLTPGSLVLYEGEVMEVHGIHRSRYKNRKGIVTTNINVEFTRPTKAGKKSASIKKCTIIGQEYNTGWEIVKKEDAGDNA